MSLKYLGLYYIYVVKKSKRSNMKLSSEKTKQNNSLMSTTSKQFCSLTTENELKFNNGEHTPLQKPYFTATLFEWNWRREK